MLGHVLGFSKGLSSVLGNSHAHTVLGKAAQIAIQSMGSRAKFEAKKCKMNTLDSAGGIDGILTADFQGDELPTPDDLVLVGVACLGILPSFRRMNAIHD